MSRVEAVYSAHAAIHQIYIYGNSHRAYLLAVIVPSSQWIAGLKQVGLYYIHCHMEPSERSSRCSSATNRRYYRVYQIRAGGV